MQSILYNYKLSGCFFLLSLGISSCQNITPTSTTYGNYFLGESTFWHDDVIQVGQASTVLGVQVLNVYEVNGFGVTRLLVDGSREVVAREAEYISSDKFGTFSLRIKEIDSATNSVVFSAAGRRYQ